MMYIIGSPPVSDVGNCFCSNGTFAVPGVCSFGRSSIGSSVDVGLQVFQHLLLVRVTSGGLHPANTLPLWLGLHAATYEFKIKQMCNSLVENVAIYKIKQNGREPTKHKVAKLFRFLIPLWRVSFTWR